MLHPVCQFWLSLTEVLDLLAACCPPPPELPPSPPCRTTHFFASSEKAKRELKWEPRHDFLSDVDACVREYKASGRQNKDIDFSTDDKILSKLRAYA